MNVFELYAKITLDTGEMDKGLEETAKKASDLGSKLKKGLVTAAKVGVAAATAAAAGIAALTKQSLDEYGEYEQLIGGVETLFKNSADVVQRYAANAYRTAGLSANEYMETVTGFSASLLQSLEGDTAKAAEVADMAITDMADNANKMGSSMESIQNAYQGFAKQNYTMLDNLKLGYGGTKEEMERLLSDAEKLSGVKYDISSYADIAEAIHVVQTEMGITGTTAKEAASTIQGSVSSMKAAWQNLLVGFADDNADMSALIGNFSDSVIAAGNNILPRVGQILTGISDFVKSAATTLVPTIVNMVVDTLPQLVSAAVTLVQALGEAIIDALPQLATAAVQIVQELAAGLVEALPVLIPAAVDAIFAVVDTLLDNLDELIDAAVAIIEALGEGLIEALPKLIEKAPEIVIALVKALVRNAPKILQAGVDLIDAMITGIVRGFTVIFDSIGKWVHENITQPIRDKVSELREAGRHLLEGLWNGISDKVQWLKDKVTGVVDKIKSWFTGKDGFDEHSPSKWAKQVFRYVLEGGAAGLESGLPGLMNSVDSVTRRAKAGLSFDTVPVSFGASGLGRATTGMVNSLFAAQKDTGGSYTINLVVDGRTLANVVFDPLKAISKQRGEAFA